MTSPTKPPASPEDRARPDVSPIVWTEPTPAGFRSGRCGKCGETWSYIASVEYRDLISRAHVCSPHASAPETRPAPSPRQDPEPCRGCGRPSAIHYDVLGDLVGCPRPSSLPSREDAERAVKAVIACARAVGFALGSGTHADVDERRESAARAALLSLIFPGDDR